MSGLRRSVYRGGSFLAARQAAGLVLSLSGVVLLTRLLGPGTYGLYAAALTLQLFVQVLASWGVGTYLVRRTGDDHAADYDRAFSLMLVAGLVAMLVAVPTLPLLERISRLELGLPALAMFLAVPMQLVTSVPMAKAERSLDFRSVARVELSGQLAFVLIAVALAVAGAGVWAPVAGFWTQHLVQAGGYFRSARYRPSWDWDADANRAMLGFGAGYSVSIWIWQARRLANPLIVGRYLGSEAVGYVAVAMQIASQLGFVVSASWRLSTAALAKVQHDAERTARAITEGMHLQALVVGPPLVAFGWVGPWLVPKVFGAEWLPLMDVYPAIALAFLTSAVFVLQSSALYVRERTWQVGAFHLANVVLLGGAALLLVPRFGLFGYAAAEVVALLSYVVLHVYVRRHVTTLSYAATAVAWLAFAAALALPGNAWAGMLLLGLILLPKATRDLVAGMWRDLRGRAHEA